MNQLTKKEKTIKYTVYCLILMLCSLLQNVSGLFWQIGSAKCFLIIPAVILLAIDEDEKISGLIGLFAGMLWDMLSAQHMGFNCIFLMLMCYITSALVSYVFRSTFWVGVVGAVLSVFLYCLTYWLVFIAFTKADGASASFLHFYLPCTIYTSVLTPILYLLIRPIKTKLNKDYITD